MFILFLLIGILGLIVFIQCKEGKTMKEIDLMIEEDFN